MLDLLPEDHKPGFFICGYFLCRLPAEIHSHLIQEDIKKPRALAKKADELWQSCPQCIILCISEPGG